ncbi:hypothetical protein ACA910_010495 [Epithemia clementina (nom. ined.)]
MARPVRGTQEEHEKFKNRLLDDVLGQDVNDKVPMEKVMLLLWAFRDDPSIVTFMARFVSKYSDSRHVFDGIEFYLPQLAHMIIHLEVDWDDAVLERFALVIAQQSMHFALQLNWILQGAIEDYCPENVVDGSPNPSYSPLFYTRCLTLKKNIERVVVYGKPRTQELQRLYEQGQITKEEMKILEMADRRFNALQITSQDAVEESQHVGSLDGLMSVKMPIIVPKEAEGGEKNKRNKNKVTNEWVTRYCVMEKTVLDCYVVPNGCMSAPGPYVKYDKSTLRLDRAMSLDKAVIEAPNTKFEIKIQTPLYSFFLQCSSYPEAKLWHRRLQEESRASVLFSTSDDDTTIKQDLTKSQLNRYEFFHHEREFVHALTQVAEDLRMNERSQRKVLAPEMVGALKIPPTVYLPLVKSTDLWRRVAVALSKETKVFNTKERCPIILHFGSRRGEMIKNMRVDPNLDVAEYMHAHFDLNEEENENMEMEMEPVPEAEFEDQSEAFEVKDLAKKGVDGVPSEGKGTTGENDDDEGYETPEEKDEDGGDGKKEEKAGGDRDMIDSNHGSISNVWDGDAVDGHTPRRGTRVKNFLSNTMVQIPSKLRTRLERNRSVSVIDRQTAVQPLVPILEGSRGEKAAEEFDNASVGDGMVVSVERSSIMVKDNLVLGALDEGDIDIESINRAKMFVSGGMVWAEKSAAMLEEAKKDLMLNDEENVQLEISSCLAKSYDDLRQEVFIMQMIHYYKSVFAQAKLPLWLRTYRILSTSSSTGLLEFLTDATSLDGLKKSDGYPTEGGLRKYFEMVYGSPDSKAFKAAQTNFMQSLAGYALVSYLLGLKDRHNGNIMIDTRGHLVFIDFGFALGMAPGHEFSMERAPFKLTKEYIEVMGGVGSECYKEFERLFVAGFEEARKNYQIALGLVEIMMFKSNYPCFSGSKYGNGKALVRFEKRLMLNVPDHRVRKRALKLIKKSKNSFGTYLYDVFQKATNGYAI